jgi:hypothetical protein
VRQTVEQPLPQLHASEHDKFTAHPTGRAGNTGQLANAPQTPRNAFTSRFETRASLNAFAALLQGFGLQEVEQRERDFISLAPMTASHCEPKIG